MTTDAPSANSSVSQCLDSRAGMESCHYLLVHGDYRWCSLMFLTVTHENSLFSLLSLNIRTPKFCKCWTNHHVSQRLIHTFGSLLNVLTFPVKTQVFNSNPSKQIQEQIILTWLLSRKFACGDHLIQRPVIYGLRKIKGFMPILLLINQRP